MKKTLAAALLLGTVGSAFAADLPSRKAPVDLPPAPIFTWTGFYAGINAGAAFGGSDRVRTATAPLFDAVLGGFETQSSNLATFDTRSRSTSFIGGGQVGYNWTFSDVLLGLEADIQGIAKGDSQVATFGQATNTGAVLAGGVVTQAAATSRSIKYLGTVRGRLGYLAVPSLLIYATGGLAYSKVDAATGIFQSFNPAFGANPFEVGAGTASSSKVGYSVGGGIEWMFMPNWSFKAEYLYYKLGTIRYGVAPLINSTAGALNFVGATVSEARFDGQIARVGLNYHFNFASTPIVARY